MTNVGISRVGVPLATASAMFTWVSILVRIAVRCSGVASPLNLYGWMSAFLEVVRRRLGVGCLVVRVRMWSRAAV